MFFFPSVLHILLLLFFFERALIWGSVKIFLVYSVIMLSDHDIVLVVMSFVKIIPAHFGTGFG